MNAALEVEDNVLLLQLNKGNNKGSPLFCIRKDPVSQQKKKVLIGISSGFNYNHSDKPLMIFYSISFYHKWISDVITGNGNAVRIAVERNTESSNSQIKPLSLFFSTLFVTHFWMH